MLRLLLNRAVIVDISIEVLHPKFWPWQRLNLADAMKYLDEMECL